MSTTTPGTPSAATASGFNDSPFINEQPGFDGKAFVYSFAVDFVF
jgi:hypothetical protein